MDKSFLPLSAANKERYDGFQVATFVAERVSSSLASFQINDSVQLSQTLKSKN